MNELANKERKKERKKEVVEKKVGFSNLPNVYP
jgi:hypothetical protein